MVDFLFALI